MEIHHWCIEMMGNYPVCSNLTEPAININPHKKEKNEIKDLEYFK